MMRGMTDATDLDVLILGAGLSGIGAAVHLQRDRPELSYAVLEAREAVGGTWDLFRYPGVRSDSDMYTLGYAFKPWTRTKGIADGDDILTYIRETAQEYGVERRIRFSHKAVRAEWSTEAGRWTVTVETPEGERELTCRFLLGCTGYYRYDEGYTPQLPGIEDFGGTVVHPQHWPEDLDYAGKRVVVIGSGATAVTLVPAMAGTAEHVTMLQRTPTWIAPLPQQDLFARTLEGRLPERATYGIVRWKNVLRTIWSYNLSKKKPHVMKKLIRFGLERSLPKGYDIDTHFTAPYDPWDQRFCVVPDGDLFKAISKGTASVVTDRIATFTPTGIRLESGQELAADVVVTATGLNMLVLGGISLVVDGEPVKVSDTVGWKGMMLSGVPNFVITVGYTNASWTLKADLVAAFTTRMLGHMQDQGYDVVVPRWSEPLPDVPFIDLRSGYVLRSQDQFPQQAERAPWRLHQNYLKDLALLRYGREPYRELSFTRLPRVEAAQPAEALAG
jgi:monooxygenase